MADEDGEKPGVIKILDYENWKIVFRGSLVCTNNLVFRLFGTWTVTFLICMALLTFLYQTMIMGDDKRPIKCIGSKNAASDAEKHVLKTVETYCFFVSTTYTRPDSGDWLGRKATNPGKPIKYNAYYQWVPYVLFLQAWIFRMPHFLWKQLEGNRMRNFCVKIYLIPKKDEKDDKKKKDKGKKEKPDDWVDNLNPQPELKALAHALKAYSTAGQNIFYGSSFIFCEVLHLLILIANMFLTHLYLGGEFLSYGRDVFRLLLEDPTLRHDPMNYVFPKETICDFRTVGPSGSIQVLNYLCILPVNILNEKVFVFLWFWFIVLLGMSVLGLLYRLLLTCSSRLRSVCISRQLNSVNSKRYKTIDANKNYWDWFVLKKLLDNMDEYRFGNLCEHL